VIEIAVQTGSDAFGWTTHSARTFDIESSKVISDWVRVREQDAYHHIDEAKDRGILFHRDDDAKQVTQKVLHTFSLSVRTMRREVGVWTTYNEWELQ